MKGILLISNFLSGAGGSRAVCEELALRLSPEFKVITASNKKARIPRLFDMLQTAWMRRAEYDVAHVAVFSGPAFLWVETTCALLRQLKKPFVLTLHGGNLPDFSRKNERRVRALLAGANAVLAPSEYLREQMRVYRRDLRLIPNALETAAYTFRRRKIAQPTLVWLRAFDEIYNPTLAPKVLKLVAEEFPDAQLTMIGPDKGDGSFENVKQVASVLGVESRLCLAGGISKKEVPQWLQRGDIFLNTSNIDNTPVSVMEAMACGLAVVSTNVGGIPYLLRNETDALLVAPNDIPAMANAVVRLLKNQDLFEKISANGRKKIEAFDWSAVLPQWREILKSAARCPL